MKYKKGLSPVITAVLLIAITISLGLAVYAWIRNYTINLQAGYSEQSECNSLVFSVGDFCYKNSADNGKNGVVFIFNAMDNSNLSISGFRLSAQFSNSIKTTDFGFLLNQGDSGTATSGFVEGAGSDVNRIIILPKISVNGKSIVCDEKETDIAKSEISLCPQ